MGRSGGADVRIEGRVSQAEFENRLHSFRGTALTIEDARSLTSLEPLGKLRGIETLVVDRAFAIVDLDPLAALHPLRHLRYGNTSLGNDRVVAIPNLKWTRPLQSLERLELIGVRLGDPDVSPLLDLPNLRELALPLRRAYRRAIFENAERNPAFGDLAQRYRDLDDFKRSSRFGS